MKDVRSRGAIVGLGLAVASVATIFSPGCARHQSTESKAQPKSEDEKAFYALGLMVGRNVSNFNLSAHELELVQSGLADSVLKKKPAVELTKYSSKVEELARKRANESAEREKARAKDLLAAAEKEPGAVRVAEGFVIKTTRAGTGAQPSEGDRVKVHYEGRLGDGTVFDSSLKRGEPVTFGLNGVIKCWSVGVARMKVGEKATLTCPSDVAYGDSGRPPTIPGGATLIFDVELLDIEKGAPTQGTMTPPVMPVLTPHGMMGMPHGAGSRPPQAPVH